jgi:hypothetical protein
MGACEPFVKVQDIDPNLDDWLPDPQVRTRHRRCAQAEAGRLWREAQDLRMDDAGALGRAVRWRIPGTTAEVSFRELFRRYPFTVLAEGENWSVSGLCGRLWTLRRDYPRIEGPEQFRAWEQSGTVRVVLGHWVEPDGGGRSALVSEGRIKPVDRQAGLRLRALWALVGHFERLIGGDALQVAASRAEARETGVAAAARE